MSSLVSFRVRIICNSVWCVRVCALMRSTEGSLHQGSPERNGDRATLSPQLSRYSITCHVANKFCFQITCSSLICLVFTSRFHIPSLSRGGNDSLPPRTREGRHPVVIRHLINTTPPSLCAEILRLQMQEVTFEQQTWPNSYIKHARSACRTRDLAAYKFSTIAGVTSYTLTHRYRIYITKTNITCINHLSYKS